MIKPLRKRHLVNWILWILLLPALVATAYLCRPEAKHLLPDRTEQTK